MCGRFTQLAPWSEVWAFSQPLVLAVPDAAVEPRVVRRTVLKGEVPIPAG